MGWNSLKLTPTPTALEVSQTYSYIAIYGETLPNETPPLGKINHNFIQQQKTL